MKKAYENSLERKVRDHINQSSGHVLLRKDLSSLGSYRQISRTLKRLIEKKILVKISQGVYAKSFDSQYSRTPLIKDGFDIAAREALDRLGVKWVPGQAEIAYNTGQTQQVPTKHVVRLKSRLRRRLSYEKQTLFYEDNKNAR